MSVAPLSVCGSGAIGPVGMCNAVTTAKSTICETPSSAFAGGPKEDGSPQEHPSQKRLRDKRVSCKSSGFPELVSGHHHHTQILRVTCSRIDLPKTSGVLLIAAISFHTIFDGIAIGVQDSKQDVWELLLAVEAHKTLAVLCLGQELAATYEARYAMILVSIFALIAPMGVAIGFGIGISSGSGQILASSILQALSVGTFMYVTFLEVLGQQLSHQTGQRLIGLLKVIVAFLGFVAMALLKLMPHEHHHDAEESDHDHHH